MTLLVLHQGIMFSFCWFYTEETNDLDTRLRQADLSGINPVISAETRDQLAQGPSGL